MVGEDWLDADARDPISAATLDEQKAAAVETSRMYLLFVDDSRGRELLARWDKTLRRRRVPVNATIQEYAAVEAVRDFVESIYRHIEFAQSEGNLL